MERRREQNRLAQRRFRERHHPRQAAKKCQHTPSPSSDTHSQERPPGVPEALNVSCTVAIGSSTDPCDGGLYGAAAYASLENINLSNMDDLCTPDLELDPTPNSLQPEPANSKTIEEILNDFACESHSLLENISGDGTRTCDPVTNDLGSSWMSPLHMAVRKGHCKIVRLLLEQDTDCNEKDSDGLTPLMHATIGGYEDVADLLLSHGVGIGYVDDHHQSALHWAVICGRDRLLKKMLKHCVGDSILVDAYTEDGRTPLHIAVDTGFEAAVEVLLESGANVQYKARGNVYKNL